MLSERVLCQRQHHRRFRPSGPWGSTVRWAARVSRTTADTGDGPGAWGPPPAVLGTAFPPSCMSISSPSRGSTSSRPGDHLLRLPGDHLEGGPYRQEPPWSGLRGGQGPPWSAGAEPRGAGGDRPDQAPAAGRAALANVARRLNFRGLSVRPPDGTTVLQSGRFRPLVVLLEPTPRGPNPAGAT